MENQTEQQAEQSTSTSAPREGQIRGAFRDLNCRGRGTEEYRMVFRGEAWQYVSSERLPRGTMRAADRHASVYGPVAESEVVCSHQRGGPVDGIGLVVWNEAENKAAIRWADDLTKRVSGALRATLGGVVREFPNPRR